MTATQGIAADDIEARRARLAEERAFWTAHYDELLARYPEQWVAVQDGEVLLRDPDLDRLVEQIEERGLRPNRDVWIDFLTADRANLLV